jgi:hypothetical protein
LDEAGFPCQPDARARDGFVRVKLIAGCDAPSGQRPWMALSA